MLEFFVWIILFSILAGCVIVVRYWIDLLRSKDSYDRDELVNFLNIILTELQHLSPSGISGYAAAACGIGLAIVLTTLGGLLSPDIGPEPDWTTSQMPNYFFQSALSVLIFHLAWPSFRTIADDSFASPGIQSFLDQDDAFFWGLSVALAAFSLTAWGVEHQISFLFVLINGLLLLFYAGYRLNNIRTKSNEFDDHTDHDLPGDSDYTGYDDEDT